MQSVSVVIPTYNRADLIEEALTSVLTQTVAPTEVIVVDDGSTDETPRLASQWPGSVRYLRRPHEERSAARNAGIRAATSEWIAFLDSDDFWDSNHVESLVSAIDPNAAAVYSGYRHQERGSFKVVEEGPSGDIFAQIAFGQGVAIIPSGTMVRRDALSEIGGFPADLRIGEDWVLFLKLASRWRFSHSGCVTATLREHAGRSMRNGTLVAKDASRAIDVALRDAEVRRRLHGREHVFRARRALAVGVSLRARGHNLEARLSLRSAFAADRSVVHESRFAKTFVRSFLPVPINEAITSMAQATRRLLAEPGTAR